MPHDLAHEEKQNEAIRELAGAVAGLAGKIGAPDVVKVVARVQAILSDDEAELVAPEPVDAPKAELHVTPPPAAAEAVDAVLVVKDPVKDPPFAKADWSKK